MRKGTGWVEDVQGRVEGRKCKGCRDGIASTYTASVKSERTGAKGENEELEKREKIMYG